MRMTTPRVAPLKEQELTPEMLDLLGPRFRGIPLLNIFRTLARAPKAYKRFMVWGGYILSGRQCVVASRSGAGDIADRV
jgi:hypothetical protein